MSESVLRRIMDIAIPQHRVFTSRQAHDAGASDQVVARLRQMRLVSPVDFGVFKLGSAEMELDDLGTCSAAVLAGGDTAFLTGDTAIAHRTEWHPRSRSIHVCTTMRGARSRQSNVVFHRIRKHEGSVEEVDGIRCARLVEAIVVMGTTSDEYQIANALDRIRFLDKARFIELVFDLENLSRRHGLPKVREALAILATGSVGTRNRLEDIMRKSVQALPIPTPRINVRGSVPELPDYEPDQTHEEARVIVEVDGGYHQLDHVQELDARRRADADAAGWHTINATWDRIRHDFSGLMREISTTVRSRLDHRRYSSPALRSSR